MRSDRVGSEANATERERGRGPGDGENGGQESEAESRSNFGLAATGRPGAGMLIAPETREQPAAPPSEPRALVRPPRTINITASVIINNLACKESLGHVAGRAIQWNTMALLARLCSSWILLRLEGGFLLCCLVSSIFFFFGVASRAASGCVLSRARERGEMAPARTKEACLFVSCVCVCRESEPDCSAPTHFNGPD